MHESVAFGGRRTVSQYLKPLGKNEMRTCFPRRHLAGVLRGWSVMDDNFEEKCF